MIIGENDNADRFYQNYRRMNDTGKQKLIRVAEDFLDIYNTVHEEKSQVEVKKEKAKFENE
jgi:hypothetical protein